MLTINILSQASERLIFFTKGLMKIRTFWGLIGLSLVFWSCDEPPAFNNPDFIYNPFTFIKDTLYTVQSVQDGQAEIQWGDHTRAWVGETKYYKSGFSVDFTVPDSLFEGRTPDSIQFQLRHQMSFPEIGSDSLPDKVMSFAFYNTRDQVVDLGSSAYGIPLGNDTMNVKDNNSFWNYTLPSGSLFTSDSMISLGVFPDDKGFLSSIYGGGSPIKPTLAYFFHEADSAGEDSVTSVSFLADTLFMYIKEQSAAFDHSNYAYISQLSQDSLILEIDLQDIIPGADTLTHIISASILPAIQTTESELYRLGSSDSVSAFYILVTDPETGRAINIELSDGFIYISNEVKSLIQDALDAGRTEISLILKPNHSGFDPGFVAISRNALESALYVSRSLAVRP